MSKALYRSKGRAAEYSPWACNFFTGCSNGCEYCYCKRGVLNNVWSTEPRLKKCFRDSNHALEIFYTELAKNIDSVRQTGILFSFSTDPMLPETMELTLRAAGLAVIAGVPVQILTKRTDWLDSGLWASLEPLLLGHEAKIAFGFTLTGFDEMEPGASLNDERIEAMRQLHEVGFRTFASIEPVITPAMSRNMIEYTKGCCDLYKVGLISGKAKDFYNRKHLESFFDWLTAASGSLKIYLKDSFLSYLGLRREELPGHFVEADYNIFKNESQRFKSI